MSRRPFLLVLDRVTGHVAMANAATPTSAASACPCVRWQAELVASLDRSSTVSCYLEASCAGARRIWSAGESSRGLLGFGMLLLVVKQSRLVPLPAVLPQVGQAPQPPFDRLRPCRQPAVHPAAAISRAVQFEIPDHRSTAGTARAGLGTALRAIGFASVPVLGLGPLRNPAGC